MCVRLRRSLFEVVTDLFQAGLIVQGDDQGRAVFLDAADAVAVGPPALSQRQLPPLEVRRELIPSLGGGSPALTVDRAIEVTARWAALWARERRYGEWLGEGIVRLRIGSVA